MAPRARFDSSSTAIAAAGALDESAAPPDRFTREFIRSMPVRYHEIFEEPAVRAHAAAAFRRGTAAAHVEVWGEREGVFALCVVTDDRAGLLSLISASLVVHDLDVIAAQAYTRPIRGGVPEVIDLFWVRHTDYDAPTKGQPDVASIAGVLSAMVDGRATVDEIATRAAHARRARAAGGTRVRFEGDGKDGLAVLVIEAWDRPGLLLSMTRALFAQKVQIIRSEIRTLDGRALNRFELAELDGQPLGRARRLQVQTEVLAVLERPDLPTE